MTQRNNRENCLLHRQADGLEVCLTGAKCDGCGWDARENTRRQALMRINGISQGTDGLYRLDIRKVEAQA